MSCYQYVETIYMGKRLILTWIECIDVLIEFMDVIRVLNSSSASLKAGFSF
jgi:hypothetical protein